MSKVPANEESEFREALSENGYSNEAGTDWSNYWSLNSKDNAFWQQSPTFMEGTVTVKRIGTGKEKEYDDYGSNWVYEFRKDLKGGYYN